MLVTFLIAAFAALALAGAIQLAIPRIAAGRVRARLTEGGGRAAVEIASFPATRLLRNRGDRLRVRGEALEIGLGRGADGAQGGLSALDGFDEVDIELLDFRTGPFAIAAFVLARSGTESYAMATQGTTTGAELVRLGEGLISGLPGGPLIGAVAGAIPISPLSSREIAISVQIELISESGKLRVGAGGGSIAGYPAGPAATAIAAAVARRLEIVP